ncbi:hypothetical protein HYZ41_02300 [archaeon]|nr:hypothetical protein [archaeon]
MKKIILLIFLAVIISGCTSNTRVIPNDGIVVNDFSADPISAQATDTVRFFLDAENAGGTTAKCVTTELFGVDSWYDLTGTPIASFNPFYPTQGLGFVIDFTNGIFNGYFGNPFTGIATIQYSKQTGTSFSGFLSSSFDQFSTQFCNAFDPVDKRYFLMRYQPELMPPNPSLGRAGQAFTKEWLLKPPILPEGTNAVYPVTARTSYFYTTNAVMNIYAFSKSEFKRMVDLGQKIDYPLTISDSPGTPIKVTVVRGDAPVVVNPVPTLPGQNYELRSYTFQFVNTGSGFPLPMSGPDIPGTSGFVLATMDINGPGAFFYDCLGQNGNTVVLGADVMQGYLKLRPDQSVPLGCTIGIDRSKWLDTPKGTITIKFSLYYRYYVDKTTYVNVIGVEGLSGPGVV